MLRDSPLYLVVKSVKSPSDFVGCIGQLIDHRDFDSFMLKLNRWCQAEIEQQKSSSKQPSSIRVQKGPVLVKDTEGGADDEIEWKRANICSVNKDMTQCFLIDEGRLVTCHLDDLLLQLPDFYFEYHPQAKQCRLNDAEPNNTDTTDTSWSQECIDFFGQKLRSGELKVNVVQRVVKKFSPFGCEYVIELTRNGENVLDLLVKMGYAQMKRIRFIDECPLSIPGETSTKKKSTSSSQHQTASMSETNDLIILPDSTALSSKETSQNASAKPDLDVMEISSINMTKDKSCQKSTSTSTKSKTSVANHTARTSSDIARVSLSETDGDDDGFEDVPGLYNCKVDDPEARYRRILQPDEFIYSDETIATGYRPNVDIDVEQLTKAVKFATVERLNAARGLPARNYKWDLPNLNQYYKAKENPRDLIKKIFYGGNGDYETRQQKSEALVKLFTKDKDRNGEIIIKTILNEIAAPGSDHDQALDLLGDCNFCSKTLFINSLKSLLSSEIENSEPEVLVNYVNSKRKNLCILLGNLYNKACYSNYIKKYSYMSYLLNTCAETISEWISFFPNKNLSANEYAKRFMSVRDFLDVSLLHFHYFDKKTCQQVLERVEDHYNDHMIKNELKSHMFQIMSVFGKGFMRLPIEKCDLRDEIERSRELSPRTSNNARHHQRACPVSASSSTSSKEYLLGGGSGSRFNNNNEPPSSDDFLSRLIQNDYL